MFRPRKCDYRPLLSNNVRLMCDVCMVQSNAWYDSARVKVSAVLEAVSNHGIPLKSENVTAVPDTYIGRKSSFIPVLESPYSRKQAAVEVSIHPMHKQC